MGVAKFQPIFPALTATASVISPKSFKNRIDSFIDLDDIINSCGGGGDTVLPFVGSAAPPGGRDLIAIFGPFVVAGGL